MSRSAKNSNSELPFIHGKSKTRKAIPIIDLEMQITEVNNKIELKILCEQLQALNLFRYFLEKSIENYYGLHDPKNSFLAKEPSVHQLERFSAYSIDRKSALTEREVEILEKLSKGWSNIRIANHFKLSVSTVKCHLQSVFLKLGVGSRFEAGEEYKRLFGNAG